MVVSALVSISSTLCFLVHLCAFYALLVLSYSPELDFLYFPHRYFRVFAAWSGRQSFIGGDTLIRTALWFYVRYAKKLTPVRLRLMGDTVKFRKYLYRFQVLCLCALGNEIQKISQTEDIFCA